MPLHLRVLDQHFRVLHSCQVNVQVNAVTSSALPIEPNSVYRITPVNGCSFRVNPRSTFPRHPNRCTRHVQPNLRRSNCIRYISTQFVLCQGRQSRTSRMAIRPRTVRRLSKKFDQKDHHVRHHFTRQHTQRYRFVPRGDPSSTVIQKLGSTQLSGVTVTQQLITIIVVKVVHGYFRVVVTH